MDTLTKEQEHRIIDLCGLILSDPTTWPSSADRLLTAIDREATLSGLWSGDEILTTLHQLINARLERHVPWYEGLSPDDTTWLLSLANRAKMGVDNMPINVKKS